MKKNLVKIGGAALLLFLVLDLTGWTLAKPERTAGEDRFIGFHLVCEEMPGENEVIPVDRGAWVSYGVEDMNLEGFGSVALPREILIGTYDEKSNHYNFPGMEGYNFFYAKYVDEEGETYRNGYTDLSEFKMESKISDAGEEHILSGTIYMSTAAEGAADYMITAYRVFQMEDGTVYLDGTGNSYGGGGFTVNERMEYTETANGETSTDVLELEFSIKDLPTLETVEIQWFGTDNVLLGSLPLDPADITAKELTLAAPSRTAWAVVVETAADGTVSRTIPERQSNGWCSHKLLLADPVTGIGREAWLKWELFGSEV